MQDLAVVLDNVNMASARLIRQASTRGVPQSSSIAVQEQRPLLDDDEDDSEDGADPISGGDESALPATVTPRAPNLFADLPVYHNIWRIRRQIISSINDPYTMEQLRAPRLNTSVVRPLMEELYDMKDISIVYCLLVNRMQFLEEQSYQAHYLSVSTARARLCELLALKILRQYDDESEGQTGLLLLANILIAGFEPFQNAPESAAKASSRRFRWPAQKRGGYERQTTALEVAIISDSKLFLSSPASQKVVDAVYVGRIIYTPTSFIDIIPDHYKHRSISIYNPRKAPLLNQYRLNVPRTRNFLEVVQFLILLALFVWVMNSRRALHFSGPEVIFCIYTFGWILDQLASILEHGWSVYSENLWSFLDVFFGVIFVIYFGLRMHGIQTRNVATSQPALDLLAMGAPLLIPRLAFNLFSENLLFVSLREMMAKFLLLTMLAVWSFLGFFLAMLWLGEGRQTPVTIGKWMVWVWFGLDGTGIQRSVEFHWLLGPLLMIAFAIFGNTLFLTILVSTLSETFSKITRSSTAEIQFRRAVLTFEGVKSDALFFYQPPTNLLAILVLLPLKLLISQRWFHKLHITAVRVINAPLLLALNLYERQFLWPSTKEDGTQGQHSRPSLIKTLGVGFGDFSRFHVHGDIQAVFDVEPPEEEPQHVQWGGERRASKASNDVAVSDEEAPATGGTKHSSGRSTPKPLRRKESVWSADGLEAHVADLVQEHTEQEGIGNKSMQERLESVEKSTKRIEDMLASISKSIDDQGEQRAEEET